MSQVALIDRLAQNGFIRPIARALTWKECAMFIICLGILPGVGDYSLFLVSGTSYLDYLFGSRSAESALSYLLPAVLMPVGVFALVKAGRPWWMLGLLPGLIMLVTKGPLMLEAIGVGAIDPTDEASSVGAGHSISLLSNPLLISTVLAVAYKLAFVAFLVKGHIRSFSFVTSLCLAVVWFGFKPALLFFALSVVFRFGYLFVTQNWLLFRTSSRARLVTVFLKTTVKWSPILLFLIPQALYTSYLDTWTDQVIYEQTGFVERHDATTELTFRDLARYPFCDNLPVEHGPAYECVDPDKTQQALRSALGFVDYSARRNAYPNVEDEASSFTRTYMQEIEGSVGSVDAVDDAITQIVAEEVRKIAINRRYAGRSERELDILLSIDDLIATAQSELSRQIDGARLAIDEGTADAANLVSAELMRFDESAERAIREGTVSSRNALRRVGEDVKDNTEAQLLSVESAVNDQLDSLPDRADAVYESVVPRSVAAFESGDCGLLDVDCGIMNMVKAMLRSAYASVRQDAREALQYEVTSFAGDSKGKVETLRSNTQASIDGLVDGAVTSVEEGVDLSGEALSEASERASNEINDRTEQLRASVTSLTNVADDELSELTATALARVDAALKTGLLRISQTSDFLRLLSRLVIALVIIKSFLYVFSRVAFAEGQDLFVTLREDTASHENGAVRKFGSVYTIPADHSDVFYISRRYSPTGRAPRIIVPHWLTAVIPRLRSGNYTMNEIVALENSRDSIEFRSASGAEFVEWQLEDGEEVVFDYRYLLGMTSNIKLENHFSARLTSMILGRSFFPIAKGPGKLIFISSGDTGVMEAESDSRSLPVDRLIAWQRSTVFSVTSELRLADVYLSDLYLQRHDDGRIVINADVGARSKTGLARFISRFLWPA